MPKLFDLDVEEKQVARFKGNGDIRILVDLEPKGLDGITWKQLQQYFLDFKRSNGGLNPAEQELFDSNAKYCTYNEALKQRIEKAMDEVYPVQELSKVSEAKKEEENKENKENKETSKTEEKINEKTKTEENKKEADKKENIAETEKKIDETANAFEKSAKKVQEMLPEPTVDAAKLAKEKRTAEVREFLRNLLDQAKLANKGLLPEDQYQAYMQDLANARAMNQQNGALEDALMQQRADTIQDIGKEYQQNRKVTPELMDKKDSMQGIEAVLTNITKNPKLLFISMILMGLNPFMALGMAVMSAFGNELVKDLYEKLPETDKSNLENRAPQQPGQEQQPAYNPQTEAYQKEMAKAQEQIQAQNDLSQKVMDREQLTRCFLAMVPLIRQAAAERERQKKKAEAEQQSKEAAQPKKEEKEKTKVGEKENKVSQKPVLTRTDTRESPTLKKNGPVLGG